MAREATTIHVNDSAILVLVAKGRKAQKWANMPLEMGLVKDGVILNSDAVASKVRELWKKQKISARRVIAGISGINCLHRLLTLPELPKDILPEAVKREAGRVLGVPLEQLYLSWQTLPAPKGETLIYLAASPRNSVDALISTLRKAGLNPYLMDLKPLALARTITEPRAIVIDLQPTSFDIVIMTEGIPQVVRSLPLVQEALREEKLPLIREELDRAITFYNSSHMDKPIEAAVPLLVCGELAEQHDAWKFLTHRQERSIQVLPSPIDSPESFPSSQYMTNIGLALKVLTLERAAISLVDFNALPEEYRPKPRPISEVLFVPVIIVGIALVVFGALANINVSTHNTDLRAQLESMSQIATSRRTQAQEITKEITKLKEQVSPVEARASAFVTTLGDFGAGRDEVNNDLAKINDCLKVGGVDLLSVSDDIETLTVAGLAEGEDAVFSYAEGLRASGRFALVVISSMEKPKDKPGMNFELTLTKAAKTS